MGFLIIWDTELFTELQIGEAPTTQMVGVLPTHKYKMEMAISKLSGKELFEFAKLNQKAKDKRISVKMTTEEWQKLKELSELNGTPMSQQMRRSFFAQNYHHFKGVAHKPLK